MLRVVCTVAVASHIAACTDTLYAQSQSSNGARKSPEQLREEEYHKAIGRLEVDAWWAVLSASLAAAVGGFVAHFWHSLKKRRESELVALSGFYECFGEFLAVRRIWNHHKDSDEHDSEKESQLFVRAAEIEARIESLLIKIASERKLTKQHVSDLGCLRQAYQSLRQHIRDGRKLSWGHSGHKQHVALKDISARVSQLLLGTSAQFRRLPTGTAESQIKSIMDNEHEEIWERIAGQELRNYFAKCLHELELETYEYHAGRAIELHKWVSSTHQQQDRDPPPWFPLAD